MLKKLLAIATLMYAAVSFAAVDVNKANAADLDGIKGIGPGISTKILDERKKGNFKDWNDFVERVKGVGDGNAAKFSAEGLTVNGAGYKGTPAAKPATPAIAAAPAPAVTPAAKEEKKDTKTDAKAKKAEEAKAKKEAAKQAKEDAKKAKAEKKDAKAVAPKDAASAAKK